VILRRSHKTTRDVVSGRVFESANAFGGRAPPGPAGGASALPPDPLAAIRGGVLLLRGRKRREMEGMGKRRKGKGRKGVKEGKGRELPPLYITSGYGRDVCLYLSTILPTRCNNLVEVIAKLKTHN